MAHGKQFQVDHAAVEAELTKERAKIAGGISSAVFRRAGKATLATFIVSILLRSIVEADESIRIGDFLRSVIGGSLFVTMFMIPFFVAASWRQLRHVSRMTSGEFVSRLEGSYRHHAGMEWVGHALLTGVWMGFGIGIPVGSLMAFLGESTDLMIPGNRWASVIAFTGITMSWTLPMAVVIRWVALRRTKRFIVD